MGTTRTTRINIKGQVTIPIEIRRSAGLQPHTEVIFEQEGGTVRIRRDDKPPGSPRQSLRVRLRGKATG